MNKKIGLIAAIIAIVTLIIGAFYLAIRERKNDRKFYSMEIRSVVIKKSNWARRSTAYSLANGIELTFLTSNKSKIEVGDSVYKTKNTFLYQIFRRNIDGVYELIGHYNYMNIE